MSLKIKGSSLLFFLLYGSLFLLLVFSRFVNIGWGMPYPFHPDERNIVVAVTNISCHLGNPERHLASKAFWKDCLNPRFFAYGQLSIYLAYVLSLISRLVSHATGPIGYEEATIVLRAISAIASVLTVFVALSIVKKFSNSLLVYVSSYLALIFLPAAIQFSHFGTTESLLMLLYTILVYLSVRYIRSEISMGTFAGASGFVIGLAAGAKISSLEFAVLPFLLFLVPKRKKDAKRDFKLYIQELRERVVSSILFGITIAAVTFVTSFYSFIDLKDFLSSLDYESAVALGNLKVFYTRTFEHTTPVLFHFTNVFPFALGVVMTAFFLIGFFGLPFKKEYNVLRFAFLTYFLPTAFTYTKWTRFMAPLFPLMVVIAVFGLFMIYDAIVLRFEKQAKMPDAVRLYGLLISSIALCVVMVFTILPGMAYLTIYESPDVRFQASKWIYKNVPKDAYIIEETANVIDIPIPPPDMDHIPQTEYKYVSFNFYDLDGDPMLREQLQTHVNLADYIFIPSRRLFANHTCIDKSPKICAELRKKYPALNNYYDQLFSGRMGFHQVAQFTSYPRITLFGKTLIEFPDEVAEETWTVFDHPVIRIYKRG